MDVQELEGLRRYLFSVAYRMLGSASDAEDVVQDAYLKYQTAGDTEIRSPKAFLTTIVTRLCLDQLKSARVSRESYNGPWLPEPVLTADLEPGPQERVERSEDVSLAFLVLLERLNPEERAAYVLREAFDYPYDEIAETLGKSSAATRQLVHRARERVADGPPRYRAAPETQQRLAERFLLAARQGDMRVLMETLADDVISWADGGAEARAARRPTVGADAVARLSIGLAEKQWRDTRVTFEPINGGMAALFWVDDRLYNVSAITVADGKIQAVHSVLAPSKLAYVQRRLAERGAGAV